MTGRKGLGFVPTACDTRRRCAAAAGSHGGLPEIVGADSIPADDTVGNLLLEEAKRFPDAPVKLVVIGRRQRPAVRYVLQIVFGVVQQIELGVEARRIEEPDELASVVRQSFGRDRPLLVDVPIERSLTGPG